MLYACVSLVDCTVIYNLLSLGKYVRYFLLGYLDLSKCSWEIFYWKYFFTLTLLIICLKACFSRDINSTSMPTASVHPCKNLSAALEGIHEWVHPWMGWSTVRVHHTFPYLRHPVNCCSSNSPVRPQVLTWAHLASWSFQQFQMSIKPSSLPALDQSKVTRPFRKNSTSLYKHEGEEYVHTRYVKLDFARVWAEFFWYHPSWFCQIALRWRSDSTL